MRRKTDLVISSTARGAAKKVIKINLLTHRDCTTTEAAAMRLHVLPDLAIKCWHRTDSRVYFRILLQGGQMLSAQIVGGQVE